MNLGYTFNEPSRLTLALTHPSAALEPGVVEHNQRLEFLGDAVVQIVVTQWLFDVRPNWKEGDLTRARQRLVNARTLARFADVWGLGEALRVGKGERVAGAPLTVNVRADAFEAVMGAVYLDGGLDAARGVLVPLLEPVLEAIATLGDPRSALLEWCQASKHPTPAYVVLGSEGPAHALVFSVTVEVAGQVYGPAAGRSKRDAMAEAARVALAGLGLPAAGPVE